MKVAIPINGKNYVPIAAVPYITQGKVSACTVLQMLLMPEAYRDAEHDVELKAYELMRAGDLSLAVRVDAKKISAMAQNCFWDRREPNLSLIGGMIVSAPDLGELMTTHAFREQAARLQIKTDDIPRLNLDPEIPWDVAVQIWAQLPLRPEFEVQRKNDRQRLADRIAAAMDLALERLAQGGMVLSAKDLPGRKQDWQMILQSLDAKISMSRATLATYLRELGFKFRRGAKHKDAIPLLKHFGLQDR
jgi:hypothetical protein